MGVCGGEGISYYHAPVISIIPVNRTNKTYEKKIFLRKWTQIDEGGVVPTVVSGFLG